MSQPQITATATVIEETPSLTNKLKDLKQSFDLGLISAEEFENLRKSAMNTFYGNDGGGGGGGMIVLEGEPINVVAEKMSVVVSQPTPEVVAPPPDIWTAPYPKISTQGIALTVYTVYF